MEDINIYIIKNIQTETIIVFRGHVLHVSSDIGDKTGLDRRVAFVRLSLSCHSWACLKKITVTPSSVSQQPASTVSVVTNCCTGQFWDNTVKKNLPHTIIFIPKPVLVCDQITFPSRYAVMLKFQISSSC